MKNILKLGLLLGVVLGWPGVSHVLAATRCVKPAGAGGCYALIQDAVDAASGGDVIAIGAGTYYENVVVPVGKDGLRIVGAGKTTTIIDADLPHTGQGLAINARDVQVSNLQIRNGATVGIYVAGSGAIVRGVNVTGANSAGIYIASGAWDVQVLASEFRDTTLGIVALGFGALVTGNVVASTNNIAIYVAGNGSRVLLNRVSTGGFGISAVADGVVVKSNVIRYVTGDAVIVSGIAPTVERNQVLGSGAGGITVTCSDCFGGSASWNVVTDTVGAGLYVSSDGPGFVVSNNTLLRTGDGLTLNGTGIRAQTNRVSDPGAATWAHCYSVFGEQNRLSRNTASVCSSAGFYVNGDDNRLDRNTALKTLENGFTVDGDSGGIAYDGNVLTANVTTGDAAQGFAILNGATNTQLIGNRASLNRVDFCNEGGAGTILSGNTFGWTVATCPIVH